MKRLFPFVLLGFTMISCFDDEVTAVSFQRLDNAIAILNTPYQLDVTEDGNPELTFTVLEETVEGGTQLRFLILVSDKSELMSSSGILTKLSQGVPIGPSGTFTAGIDPLATRTTVGEEIIWEGAWKDANEWLMGFRYKIGENDFYYGWLRLSVDQANNRIVLQGVALQRYPDTKLNAGQLN